MIPSHAKLLTVGALMGPIAWVVGHGERAGVEHTLYIPSLRPQHEASYGPCRSEVVTGHLRDSPQWPQTECPCGGAIV